MDKLLMYLGQGWAIVSHLPHTVVYKQIGVCHFFIDSRRVICSLSKSLDETLKDDRNVLFQATNKYDLMDMCWEYELSRETFNHLADVQQAVQMHR